MGVFLGRGADVAAVRALFADGERLVTLTGAAGIGKTRLAREVIAVAPEGGVVECDLSEARSLDDVVAALARALGTPALRAREGVLEQVAGRLAERGPVLLFVDNFEQVVGHADAAIGALFDAAPQARALVTSRERLRVDGEVVYELAPLGTDDGVALLAHHVERARRAGVDPAEAALFAEICRELDGLPLALELAAVRVAVLGAKNVIDRLDRRFEVLTRARGAARARTLRSAIDWSWDLLGDAEKRAFAACSALRGEFTLDAALAVLGETDAATGVDLVQSLCEKSLVVARHDAAGRARFVLLATMREYAAWRLEELGPEERDAVFARHAEHTLAEASRLAAETNGPRGAQAIVALAALRENLHAIAERALASGDGELAARALLVLAPIVLADGPIEPYLVLADRALALPLAARARIALLSARGRSRRRRGRVDDADVDERTALDLARGERLPILEGRILGERAMTAYARCDFDAARSLLERALDVQRAERDAKGRAISLTQLAMVHRERGDLAAARDAACIALPIHRASANAVQEATTLTELALCDLEEDRLDVAREGLAAALDVSTRSGSRVGEAFVRGFVAVVDHAAGDLARAEQGYVAALRVSRDVGYARFEGGSLGYLGEIAFDRGDHGTASSTLARARDLLLGSGDRRHAALATAYLAASVAARGQRARALFADARALVDEEDPLRTAVELVAAFAERRTAVLARLDDHARRSWNVRLALARLGASALLRRPSSRPPPSGVRGTLAVAIDGSGFTLGDGAYVSCESRAATQRVLAALARARSDAPGRAVSAGELVARGWPGERILPAAAKNRLRVAAAWLRKAGLGSALASYGDGYFLDPALVAVDTAAAPEPAARRTAGAP